MKNTLTIMDQHFPVLVHDHRTGQEEAITVTVTKDQLRAAQIVDQSSNELVERMLDRQGYAVIEIGAPDCITITLDLEKLVDRYEEGWTL